ncbi:ATP-binding protein [Paenibacillus oenotherae]|nr:ATP-binding protein [Paenibacillus oenotherae]
MSVKTKLSFMISFIVFVLLVLNVILNEYSTRVNLQADTESNMLHMSKQIAQNVTQYAIGYRLLEEVLEDKLLTASIAAANKLGPDLDKITTEQLQRLAIKVGVTDISLMVKENGEYRVVRSSDYREMEDTLMYRWGQRSKMLKQTSKTRKQVRGHLIEFWTNPVEWTGEESSFVDKWAFYDDKQKSYVISCFIRDYNTINYGQIAGPTSYISQMLANNPVILEITGFNSNLLGKEPIVDLPPAVTADDMFERPLAFGSYNYEESKQDMKDIGRAKEGEVVFRQAKLHDRDVMKSFVPIQEPSGMVVGIVLDKEPMMAVIEEQRINLIMISIILLVIVVFCIYWLSDLLIRPIRSILWKVNEVSFGRFDNSIEVNRKDELGQLAQRVNAMSKNLGVYMNKLKLAFEENRSMKEYLESFINQTTDAIHVVDLDGRITQVNRAFEQLFEYSADEALGNMLSLVPDHLIAEEQQTMEWLNSGKLLPARETIRVTKSGEWISVSVTTSPIRDKNGAIRAIASITRDMTSRNKMEELLRRSEKLTTVGQLAAGVAHEIRNPLTTLRGFLQLQLETSKFNSRHVDIMLSELDRINLIVGEFLILAKPQATRFEEKDVRFIFGDVISLLDSQAHLCDIVFETDFSTDSCLISCEENQLKQVFINVIKNAIEAMPQGGVIQVEIKRGRSGHVLVSITDEGIGIPEDIIPKLGDPFFTGKDTGTGLGIMVSQRIIQSHYGTMDIVSKVNVGTKVTISLPLLMEGHGDL